MSTSREALDRYLDSGEYRKKVTRFKADGRTCLEAIHAVGGKVSLAHAYQMKLPDAELEAQDEVFQSGDRELAQVQA